MKITKTLKTLLFAVAFLSGTLMYAQEVTGGVSEKELTSYANTLQELQTLNQNSQAELFKKIQDAGLSPDKFQQLHFAMQDETAKADLSKEDKEAYKRISDDIQKMQPMFQQRMEALIKEHGFNLDRFEEIAKEVRDNPELAKKLQALLVG